MGRDVLFSGEAVSGIRGLAGLTQPSERARVSAVIDVAVVGARSDGKTQFIAHAIRTLRAYAPADLAKEEVLQNQDILQVVMNARDPRPEATVPGRVRHYTFRARPQNVLAGLGRGARLAMLIGRGFGRALVLLALLNGAALFAGLAMFGTAAQPVWQSPVFSGIAALVGCGVAYALARARFIRAGEVELVFWDVAGEEVYSSNASGYYTFLSTLVQRRVATQPTGRAYGFAPVLMCNPLALGRSRGDSAYARMRQLMPQFAALTDPQARVLCAVNRWALASEICRTGSKADELCAVVPSIVDDDAELGGAESDDDDGDAHTVREPLPVVRRSVVRKHCLDTEGSEFSDTEFTTLHYDAGLHAEVEEKKWPGWADLSPVIRRRFAEIEAADVLLHYRYAEGPGAFEGKTRRRFFAWLMSLPRTGRTDISDDADEPGRKRNTGELFAVGRPTPVPGQRDDETTGGFRTGGG